MLLQLIKKRAWFSPLTSEQNSPVCLALEFFVQSTYYRIGVGYAFSDTDSAEGQKIHPIRDWGSQQTDTSKIPSVISYSPCSDPNEQQFGYDLSPNAVVMVNTKLELDVQRSKEAELDLILQALDGMDNLSFDNVKKSNGHPEYTWKEPEDIVADYLSKLFPYVNRVISKEATLRKSMKVDVVVTVPIVGQLY
jgi:hypothetical protein